MRCTVVIASRTLENILSDSVAPCSWEIASCSSLLAFCLNVNAILLSGFTDELVDKTAGYARD